MRKDLGVDEHTLSMMVRICRALDGMPLAIELAAARLRTMSIEQLANRLDDRFRLLTGGSRTALPRHKTLRAVVDWSWELLTDTERTVLSRLSVLSGGVSLEAAERVCAGDAVEQEQVLELLTALAEKSLLLTEGDGAPRYRMLDTIKEYAAQRLVEARKSDPARQAHLATSLRCNGIPHRTTLAVGVRPCSGALADADLDVSRAVHQLRLTVCHPADANSTAGRCGGDVAVGVVDVEVPAAAVTRTGAPATSTVAAMGPWRGECGHETSPLVSYVICWPRPPSAPGLTRP